MTDEAARVGRAPGGDAAETTPGTAPLLRVRDLHVRIAGSHILQGVHLAVSDSGVTALLGRNGVGKSTTVRAVLGLVPRTGEVRLDGRDITASPTHEITAAGVGYVPEDRGVFRALTVAENLRLAHRRGGAPRYDLVHELFPELRRRAAQTAGTLSGGQQQMLAIGRALLNEQRLLVVDEPTKGLAPRVVAEVADAMARVAHDVPVLLVEQNLTLVRRIADQAVVLDAGRVAHTGPAGELLADPERTRELLGVGRAPGRGSTVAPATNAAQPTTAGEGEGR